MHGKRGKRFVKGPTLEICREHATEKIKESRDIINRMLTMLGEVNVFGVHDLTPEGKEAILELSQFFVSLKSAEDRLKIVVEKSKKTPIGPR
jgi:hypothetical protein